MIFCQIVVSGGSAVAGKGVPCHLLAAVGAATCHRAVGLSALQAAVDGGQHRSQCRFKIIVVDTGAGECTLCINVNFRIAGKLVGRDNGAVVEQLQTVVVHADLGFTFQGQLTVAEGEITGNVAAVNGDPGGRLIAVQICTVSCGNTAGDGGIGQGIFTAAKGNVATDG